jgi:hypothetical protein
MVKLFAPYIALTSHVHEASARTTPTTPALWRSQRLARTVRLRPPADPIGPEHGAAAPDLRAAWHEALAALGPASGPDVRGLPDGILLHLRDTYPLETAWAPRYFGDELRQVRAVARDAHLAAIRVAAGAQAAERRGQHEQAAEQQVLAASYQALHDAYRDREAVFAVGMAVGADWDAATRH